MVGKNAIRVLTHLRRDARMPLARIGRSIGIPPTAVNQILMRLERYCVKKHTSLLDFHALGYYIRICYAMKCKDRSRLLGFLENHMNVNNIHRIKKYDFFAEAVFRSTKDSFSFLDSLKELCTKVKEFQIIDEMKSEGFLTKEGHVNEK